MVALMATATDQRLSEQVSDAARRLGLTQTALAAMAGISDTAFSRRMNGHTKWTLSEVAKVARVLELDLHALLEGSTTASTSKTHSTE